MFRHHTSQALLVVAVCSGLAGSMSLVRCVSAKPGDIVDLEGDTHHNPPASTTDKSTPKAGTASSAGQPISKETREIKDAAKQEAAEEKLKARAGERVGNSARGSAQVLGMSLQEGTRERVKVVDVAMNSPAFDAGVMKGDEILAFQGFRGESYRKWIDGIRRLTTDTGAGLKIPVVVARDGKQLTVGIVVPEKPVRPSTLRPLAQPESPLIQPGVAPPLPTPGGPNVAVVNGGNNVAIDNSGPFGDFFGGQSASPNERAMAQIFRIGGKTSPNPNTSQDPTAGVTAAPIKGGARIGMAGFRDEPSGMVVMVDVGTLPPGNYTVGISDPALVGGAAVTGTGAANPNVQAQSPSSTAPPTGEINPATRPPGGEVNPATRTPTGQLSVNTNRSGQATTGTEQNSEAGTSGVNQIGTITVDQSGTGRMQQKIESLQVRSVVGQAIVLYSQGEAQTALPSNLKHAAKTASRQSATAAPVAGSSQQAADASGVQGAAAAQPTPERQATAGPQVPVAAGIIQLVTDRRPPPTQGPQASQTPAGPNGAVEQPATATPPAERNLLR